MDAAPEPGMADRWRWAVAFFVVTYLVTALLWWPILRDGQPLSALAGPRALLLLLATVVPSVVGLVLAGIEGGTPGVVALLGQAGRWRFGLGWYALAILLPPLVALVTLAGATLLGGPAPVIRLDFLLPVAAVGEEFGWRGYALPRLQERLHPLGASLVIGVFWSAWHLPYFADRTIHPLPLGIDFPLFAVAIVAESVLATWIYNSTRRSLLATMLYHHSIHVASIVPVVPGIIGAVVQAIVNVAAAAAAVAASGGSLVGVRRSGLLRPSEPHRAP